MKTIGLILLGSVLTIGIQFIEFENIHLLSDVHAAGNSKPCRVINGNEDTINNLYTFGYRVKGVGGNGGPPSDNSSSYIYWDTTVVMCRD